MCRRNKQNTSVCETLRKGESAKRWGQEVVYKRIFMENKGEIFKSLEIVHSIGKGEEPFRKVYFGESMGGNEEACD